MPSESSVQHALKFGNILVRQSAGVCFYVNVLANHVLSCIKRFESYETIGGLFAEVTGETIELSVAQRIWALIVETISVIAELTSCETYELIEDVINNGNKIKSVKEAFDRLESAGLVA